jgi:hypothetical protein
MRKITERAYNAFMNKTRFKKENTEVRIVNGLPEMYLFGNRIAIMDEIGNISISSAGWASKTTCERLSAFAHIRLNKGSYIVKEKFRWNGEWLNLSHI